MTSPVATGRCRDCRSWNGGGGRPAPCFKIRGLAENWTSLDPTTAAFYDPHPGPGSYLITGPEFGCVLFEPGKPRDWGDCGD